MAKSPLKSSKGMNVPDLLALIPESLHSELIATYSVDKWVQKLKGNMLFKLVLYSILNSDSLSLRTMAENHRTPWFRAVAYHSIDHIAHTSIRARLMSIPISYFEKLYEHVYAQLAEHYTSSQLKRYHIKRYDSTMVCVYAHLLDGMRVGNTSRHKRQVKFTTELCDDLLIQMHFHSDQGHLSEERALTEIIKSNSHGPRDIIVFDRGLKKRDTFVAFEEQSVQFVTRANEQLRYQVIESAPNVNQFDTESLHFIQDSTIKLYGSGDKLYDTPFRLIQAVTTEDDKPLFFITNISKLTPDEIAHIYKARWEIEVLFRFMKQEMNLTHLVSHQQNAIQAMLYMTVIAAMLVLTYRKLNQIRAYKTAKMRFFNELQAAATLEMIEREGGVEQLRANIKNFLKRE
jgi:hypothetical protein